MNLDSLTHTSGEWLRGSGPGVRHRHLQPDPPGPQPGRVSRSPTGPAATRRPRSRACCATASPSWSWIRKLDYLNVPGLSPLDRQFLVERQLISRELAAAEGPRGVALGPRKPSA